MIQIKYDSSDFMNILWKINNSDFGSAEKMCNGFYLEKCIKKKAK